MRRQTKSTISAHERAVLTELADLAHGIAAPFACGGKLKLKEPVKICMKNGEEFVIERAERPFDQKTQLEPLFKRCSPAPFGHGKETKYNRHVRDALQLQVKDGAFSVKNFDPEQSGVLGEILKTLAPRDPNPLTAELYNLNIYMENGHFKAHKDTPRGDDMLGTLVVCLPSHFSNGNLVLNHRGAHRVFDWANAIRTQEDSKEVHWAAFFGDVDHSIQRIWTGARVTLTYILRRGKGARIAEPVSGDALSECFRLKLSTALADRQFLPKGSVLAFPCFHMYSQEAVFQKRIPPLTIRSVLRLKGSDQLVARAAILEGLAVAIQPYLVETCADETWKLKHFPAKGTHKKLGDQLAPRDLKRAMPYVSELDDDDDDFVKQPDVTWVEPPPKFNCAPVKPVPMSETDTENPDPAWPAIRFFHACEYSSTGYFGNEGSDTEFYVYAALHIFVPPYGEGVRTGTKPSNTRNVRSSPTRRMGTNARSASN